MSENNLPASPLRDLIRKAADRPSTGVIAKERQKAHETALLRAERIGRGTKGKRVLVCDYSSSMDDLVSGKTKHQHMMLAVEDCVKTYPGIQIVVFSDRAYIVPTAADIPEPCSGTDLAAGLRVASSLNPEHSIVITDGYPNDRSGALDEARRMSGVIDVVYCGHDTDREAIEFMNELAACGCGQSVTWDAGRLALGGTVKMLMLNAASQ